MPTIAQIKPHIVSTLQLVTELQRVYDHEPKKLIELPAATMYFDGFGQTDATSRRKKRLYRWHLRVYVALQDDEDVTQNEVETIVENVLDRLAANPDLGGTVTNQNVSNGEIYVALDQNNPYMIAEMTLEVEVDLYF